MKPTLNVICFGCFKNRRGGGLGLPFRPPCVCIYFAPPRMAFGHHSVPPWLEKKRHFYKDINIMTLEEKCVRFKSHSIPEFRQNWGDLELTK